MTHSIKVQPLYYNKIKSGEKTYEVRLYDEKRQLFKVGDTLIIKREPDLKEEVVVKVTDILHFSSFEEMAKSLPLEKVGFNINTSVQEVVDLYHTFYPAAMEKKYGVVAIKIKLI